MPKKQSWVFVKQPKWRAFVFSGLTEEWDGDRGVMPGSPRLLAGDAVDIASEERQRREGNGEASFLQYEMLHRQGVRDPLAPQ